MQHFVHRGLRWGVAGAVALTLRAATVGAEGPQASSVPSVPSKKQPDGDVASTRTKARIQEVIRSHILEVKSCYEMRLVTQPNLEGRVLVDFLIAPTGQVAAAIVLSSTVDDRKLEECLVAVVKTMRFPADRGTTVVSYPNLFKAAPPETPRAGTTLPSASKVVLAAQMKKEQLTEVVPHLPDAAKREHCGKTLNSSYKLCVALDGTINSVSIIEPVPGADYAIIEALYQWKYKPQSVPVCFIQHFAHELAPCPPVQPAEALGTSTGMA